MTATAQEATVRGTDALSVVDLGVCIGSRLVVAGVSFTARAGEIVAVIGPNGAGKTTLLESVVGIRRARSGSIRLHGRELQSFGDRSTTFAFAPDDAAPPAEASVRTLVEHARAHRPRSKDDVDRLLRDLRVDVLLDAGAGTLSRGEWKRVALLLSLVADRPVVVLDEPFGAFDPLQLREVLEVVRSIARAGSTVLVSIHQLANAAEIADRVLLLARGRRVAFGAIEQLRAEAGLPGATLDDVFVALLSRERRDAT